MRLILADMLERLNPTLNCQASTSGLAKRRLASMPPSAMRRPLLRPPRLRRLPWHLRLKLACVPGYRPAASTLNRILQQRLRCYAQLTAQDRLRELLLISNQCASRAAPAEQLAMEIIGTQIITIKVMESCVASEQEMAMHAVVFSAMTLETLLAHYQAPDPGSEAYAMAYMAIRGNIGQRADQLQAASDTVAYNEFVQMFGLQ